MGEEADVGKAVPKEQRQGWGQVRIPFARSQVRFADISCSSSSLRQLHHSRAICLASRRRLLFCPL